MICEVGCYEHSCKNIPEWTYTLRPGYERELWWECKRQQATQPDDYTIYTNNTHVVCLFPYDKVVVISQSGKRATLDKHPKYRVWKEEFHAGEFWSCFGEAWVDDLPEDQFIKMSTKVTE